MSASGQDFAQGRGATLHGRVGEMGGGVYRVLLDDGRWVEASLRGRLKLEARRGDRVVVGDRVEVRISPEGEATVESVEPRATELLRRGPLGRKPKVVAANVDRALVVAAARDPEPRRELVDRFLALAGSAGIPATLVVNKVDLPGARRVADELCAFYRGIPIPAVAVSAASGEGLEALRALLSRGTTVIVGPSGVGKSSLLNALQAGLELRTAPVGLRRGRGRHTTVGARLIPLEGGGEVVDTPGFSDAALWEVEPQALARAFPEVARRMGECRFRGCSHTHEPGCAVRAAVEEGAIDPGRYASWVRLLEEARE